MLDREEMRRVKMREMLITKGDADFVQTKILLKNWRNQVAPENTSLSMSFD